MLADETTMAFADGPETAFIPNRTPQRILSY